MTADKIRVRACGLAVQDGAVLLVNHKRFMGSTHFPETAWILPGGAVEPGEPLHEGVKREVFEETGFKCEVGKLLFVKELIFPYPDTRTTQAPESHSISLGFHCRITGGELTTGIDPEFSVSEQLILESKWIPISELHKYTLYPPFLAAFIAEYDYNQFETIAAMLFSSRE
ncbi:MAG: NUDIX domain-containing protein [Rhizobacter sp.]|nr:NUDIX domain-containing protein [Chlorobiales bacterium]